MIAPSVHTRRPALCATRCKKTQAQPSFCPNRCIDPMRIDGLHRFVSGSSDPTLLTLAAILFTALPALAEPVSGSLPAQWNIGAEDCVASPQPPLQVHTYEPQTFILRQSPCASFEANFIYLLIGSDKALLIDTGAVSRPESDAPGENDLGAVAGYGRQKASAPGRTY